MAVKPVGVGDTPNAGRIKWNESDDELQSRLLILENAANLLALIRGVDGPGSDLNADLVDGQHASAFVLKAGDTGVTPFALTGDPTSASHVVRRSWVENFFAAKDQKDNVRAATNAPLPAHTAASGATSLTANANGALPLATFDNVALAVGDRVLVKNEPTSPGGRNLIYTVTALGSASTAWVLTRASDSDPGELTNGAFVYVAEPLSGGQGGTSWWVTTPDPITVGTTPITWAQFGGPGAIQAGSGLTRTGNMISVALEAITSSMILNGTVVADDIAAAHKDGLPGVLSLRTLGTGAQQALPGDHASVTNARTPTAHAASHMAGSDPITAVGIGALPSNDSRIHARNHGFGSVDDHVDLKGAIADGQVWVKRTAGAQGEGYYPENPASASVPDASTTARGIVEKAEAAELQTPPANDAGGAGQLYVPPAALKTELDRRRVIAYFFDAERTGTDMELGAANASTKIIFNTENTDKGAWYDPATGLATIPATGLYRLFASVKWSTPASTETAQIKYAVNGVSPIILAFDRFNAATEIITSFEIELPFTLGQTVEIQAQTSLGAINASFAPSTRFQMRYLGPLS